MIRITKLEEKAQLLYGKYFFEEWFQKHFDPEMPNYWALLDIAPQEFRLDCMLRIIKEPGLLMHQGKKIQENDPEALSGEGDTGDLNKSVHRQF